MNNKPIEGMLEPAKKRFFPCIFSDFDRSAEVTVQFCSALTLLQLSWETFFSRFISGEL